MRTFTAVPTSEYSTDSTERADSMYKYRQYREYRECRECREYCDRPVVSKSDERGVLTGGREELRN